MSSTDYSESTEAFLQKYSDTSKYHPWDLTILKYSDEIPEFMTLRYFAFWNAYQREEKIGTPPRLPIPAPPLRPAEVLEPAIEKWRQNILQVIESRTEHYSPRRIVDTTPHSSLTSFDTSGTDDAIPHHALQIPEVLAIILHHAELSSQYSAWHVSTLWRRTTEYIWNSQYKASTSTPVQNGQGVQKQTLEEPTEQEIDEMVKEMENIVHSEHRPEHHYYFPARLT
ncbi:hypothetical protein BS50DRAFT_633151 [Corynespora cassiicola Philippines]|uniref:Uncharacterized protein n=1 Tax=Corynespora cassiicola Philippines TaxID=1448308 RepID=A0A2T2NVH5_CORCC|nr:hypothetical protein BS50DRAFT_633151 [Corynespora cassiicola Philippines]